jgi:hypothetical protein
MPAAAVTSVNCGGAAAARAGTGGDEPASRRPSANIANRDSNFGNVGNVGNFGNLESRKAKGWRKSAAPTRDHWAKAYPRDSAADVHKNGLHPII